MKTKSFIKKGAASLLAGLVALTAVGCNVAGGALGGGGGSSNADTTQIYVQNFGGGVGVKWLDNAWKGFAQEVKDTAYEDSKKGVEFKITSNTSVNTSTMQTDGEIFYFAAQGGTPYSLGNQGVLYDLTDIITEKVYDNGTKSIEDKLTPEVRELCKGKDGKYYALPHYEIYPCLTINRAVYDEYGLYFGAPDSTASEWRSPTGFGSAKILGINGMDNNLKKSCGVDGEYGTYDDGLPTSIQELLIMCDYMYRICDVVPFTVSGHYTEYYSLFLIGLMAQLMGPESYKVMFSFDGEMEVVTGLGTEDLFYSGSGIKKPDVETETITDENGYLVREASARYYATAFTEIAVKQNWFSDDSKSTASNHLATQRNFLNGGKQGNKSIAMLIEGNYWMNESDNAGYFKQYKALYGKEPQIEIVPFPTLLEGTIAENAGKDYVLASTTEFTYVNKNVEKTPALMPVVKDFLQYLYRDENLKSFTATSGCVLGGVDYDFGVQEVMSSLHTIKQTSIRYSKDSKVVIQRSANPIFADHIKIMGHNIDTETFRANVYPDEDTYKSYFDAIYKGGETTANIFNYFKIPQQQWAQKYLGE